MIPRYTLPEMAGLWSDEARFATWLEIELLAVEAWSGLGRVPADHARAVRERAPMVSADFVRAVSEREAVTDHDVAAFVDVVQEAIGHPEGSWIHYGLTSYDVVDTALSARLVKSTDLLLEASTSLVDALKHRAHEFKDTAMVGRTPEPPPRDRWSRRHRRRRKACPLPQLGGRRGGAPDPGRLEGTRGPAWPRR